MDLLKLPLILRKWWLVFVFVVAAAMLTMTVRLVWTDPVYEARVRVGILAPASESVALPGAGSPPVSFVRENVTLERNDFILAVRSSEVYDSTVQQLGLETREKPYPIGIQIVPDSHFVDLTATAATPHDAQLIVSAHASQAIRYYGRLRAKPFAAMKELIGSQLEEAETTLARSVPRSVGTLPVAASAALDAEQIRTEQALDTYRVLLKKQAEITLAESDALQATNVQIAEGASPAVEPSSRSVAMYLGLSLVGGIGLAFTHILLLDSLFPRTRVAAPDFARRPSRMRQEDRARSPEGLPGKAAGE